MEAVVTLLPLVVVAALVVAPVVAPVAAADAAMVHQTQEALLEEGLSAGSQPRYAVVDLDQSLLKFEEHSIHCVG
jgi:hypothetical protein